MTSKSGGDGDGRTAKWRRTERGGKGEEKRMSVVWFSLERMGRLVEQKWS